MSLSPTAPADVPAAARSGRVPAGGEALMARAACRLGAAAVLPAVALAWWLRGVQGGLTALGAVMLVVAAFAATGWSLSWAGRYGLGALQAVALGGFGLRLGLYAAAVIVLEPLEVVDGPVLAVTAAVVLMVLLAYEVRLLTGRAELWFVQPQAAERLADGRNDA